MLRRRILYIAALLLALLGQILDVGYLFHFAFFAVLVFPLLGLLISLPAMLGCRAELTASAQRLTRGESASWTLSISNRFRLPVARTSYRLRVSNRLSGEVHSGRSVLRDVMPEEDRVWTLESDHCGIELPEGTGIADPLPGRKSVSGENYELRAYREGDSLRMIHWKMSAKRDELVTRETPEVVRLLPVLTFDHFGLMEQVDRTLDRLEGYSTALLEQDRPHEVRWVHPETGAVRRYPVNARRGWEVCLAAILSDPAPLRGRSIGSLSQERGPIYQIHVDGKEEVHGSA